MLDQARFAFLVMTAEDEQADGNHHARMNVIHEVGLFQGTQSNLSPNAIISVIALSSSGAFTSSDIAPSRRRAIGRLLIISFLLYNVVKLDIQRVTSLQFSKK
jgi:hypothetical protein